jgi:transcriptional regulator with XRE-family HTH domain
MMCKFVSMIAPMRRPAKARIGPCPISNERYYLLLEMRSSAAAPFSAGRAIEHRIAQRLARLRAERGWSLDMVADRTGISRATLSRLERGELSPTAAMLGQLCTAYRWTLSRLMADAETRPPNVIRAAEQVTWRDPDSGYRRRVVSPPAAGLRGELVEVQVPAGAAVSFDASPVAGLEHHLWMLEGALALEIDGSVFQLRPGDCMRYVLTGSTRFHSTGRREARYLVAIVHP